MIAELDGHWTDASTVYCKATLTCQDRRQGGTAAQDGGQDAARRHGGSHDGDGSGVLRILRSCSVGRCGDVTFRMRVYLVVLTALVAGGAAHDAEEGSPLLDVARQMLQASLDSREGGAAGGAGAGAALGGLLQSFMQSDGGRQLGDMLLGGSAGAAGGGSPAADILSGLGSLIGGGKGGGGLDPAIIGHMMDIFTKSGDDDNTEDNEVDVNNNDVGSKRSGGGGQDGAVDWGALLGAASSLVGSQGGAADQIMSVLPALLQGLGAAGHSHHEDDVIPEDERDAHRGHHIHSHKSNMLPPFLDKLYDMWEHFSESDLGRTLWHTSGLDALVKLFTDPKTGRFQTERIFASLENASFRRRWIKSVSSFVAEWAKRVADPATQTRYLATAQFVGNNFLKAQGYPKATHFDPARPAESLSLLANAVFKRHFGLKVNSATYIKPAVAYIQDVLRLGQSKGLSIAALSSTDIESRLSDTINGEVLEPMLRVWRAYRFSSKVPQCGAYVLCVVNQQEPAGAVGAQGGPGIKPGVTKLSSMVAAWFMSGNNETPFWKLYNAAVEDHDCSAKYHPKESCAEFHEEDLRATTEYAHNEL
ncbi:Protein ZGRF1 [Frankliniella fusca]|uniref:Protein ZGRF1 n=1 Tax=Frankliniella fusca TaxID=407009 RepID=A0AAE1HC58_9NEOP|nr:Protein ZGRF1 [Frankliniella fusca]